MDKPNELLLPTKNCQKDVEQMPMLTDIFEHTSVNNGKLPLPKKFHMRLIGKRSSTNLKPYINWPNLFQKKNETIPGLTEISKNLISFKTIENKFHKVDVHDLPFMGTTKIQDASSELRFNLFSHIQHQLEEEMSEIKISLEVNSQSFLTKLVKVPFFEDMCKINRSKVDQIFKKELYYIQNHVQLTGDR